MRTLRFIVDGQIIKADPDCDFSNIVPGTEGYLQAEFLFSPEWNGYVKVAGFNNELKAEEYPPQILKDGKTCMIPYEATSNKRFQIFVVGKNGDSKMKTNTVEICQTGGDK